MRAQILIQVSALISQDTSSYYSYYMRRMVESGRRLAPVDVRATFIVTFDHERINAQYLDAQIFTVHNQSHNRNARCYELEIASRSTCSPFCGCVSAEPSCQMATLPAASTEPSKEPSFELNRRDLQDEREREQDGWC